MTPTKLFIPGPVSVEEEILQEMARPMIGHRTEEFKELHREIINHLHALLGTQGKAILLLTCSATGAMEAAVRNTMKSNALCLANGAFGKRWYAIACENGKDATLLDFGNGIPFNLHMIQKELDKKSYDTVTMVLNESATGIENSVEDLQKILVAFPRTLLLVDMVTGVFGTPIDFTNIDVAVFGTQKALALPPGVAIVVASEKVMATAEQITQKGFYFDFVRLRKKAVEDYTLTTPNIPLLFALNKRLKEIRDSGIQEYLARHQENATLTRQFFQERGFSLLVDDKDASRTVTVIQNKHNLDIKQLIAYLQTKGYSIANGYGELKDKTFRIGHMGVSVKDTKELLQEIDVFLRTFL